MMKSSLLGLFLLLLLSSTVSGLGSVLVKSFEHIQHCYTWHEAQTFCRRSHSDLAIIYEQAEVDNLDLEQYIAWIGLKITNNEWVWTDRNVLDSEFFLWSPWYEQISADTCAYVSSDKRFNGTDCGQYYFFICYKHVDDEIKYTFINQSKTWSDAQLYCQDFYDDLAVIRKNRNMNLAVQQQDFPIWTGLYRDGDTWKWSKGESEYRKLAQKQPGNDGDCVAIYSLSKKMITQSCSTRYPFLCFKDNLVLVKENKTWEEALKHCNDLNFQLVSVQPGDDYRYMMDRITEAETEEVWTGLRFLAGNWMWVNGADVLFSDLVRPPLSVQSCGAFSKNDTGSLETRDCLEKNNFLCYSQG